MDNITRPEIDTDSNLLGKPISYILSHKHDLIIVLSKAVLIFVACLLIWFLTVYYFADYIDLPRIKVWNQHLHGII